MRISRLYVALPLLLNKIIELDEENAHYLRTVLRLKADDEIVLFNGDGGEFFCRVVEVSRKTVAIKPTQFNQRDVESPLFVHLGLGIARGDRMDFSMQKAVELGVNCITPLLTERCVVQFKGEKKPQRWQHWQKISHHASEQSGRTQIAEFHEITPLSDWLSQQQGLRLFLDPYASTTLTQLPDAISQVTLLTGPEGGFTNSERKAATAAGFIGVRLGSRILRTETATLAALAAVQTRWGDFF